MWFRHGDCGFADLAGNCCPLAKEAGVSLGQGFNVKKLLVDREWMETGDDGFRLKAVVKAFKPHLKLALVKEGQSMTALLSGYCGDQAGLCATGLPYCFGALIGGRLVPANGSEARLPS